jgi:dCMP deaminase
VTFTLGDGGEMAITRARAGDLPTVVQVDILRDQLTAHLQRVRVPRLDWDPWFMLHAHLAATRSTCDRGPELLLDPPRRGVGAVLVRDHRALASGYSGSPPGEPHCCDVGHLMINGSCVRTLHAEENALLQCALECVSPRGATIYSTASPCWDCAKQLLRAGVARVLHAEEYASRRGLSGDALDLLRRNGVEVERLDVRPLLPGFAP